MDLVTRLRMRLSEPHLGTWGVVDYEYNDEHNQEGVNELALMLNEAQEYLCRDLYDKSFAFFESQFQHPIIPKSDKYVMPSNFMAIESVFQRNGSDFSELTEANIKELLKNDAYGTYSYYNNNYLYNGQWYTHYEIRGNAGTTVAEGQIPFTVDEAEGDSNSF